MLKDDNPVAPLLNLLPKMRQLVTLPTRGDEVLDVIITNLGEMYLTPVINPPVSPDQPTHSPSDHSVLVAHPLSNLSEYNTREYEIKKYRVWDTFFWRLDYA